MDTFFEMRGEVFSVDAALENSSLRKHAEIWRRGEICSPGSQRESIWKDSGFSIHIGGDDDTDLKTEIADAILFLKTESAEVLRLRDCRGIEKAHIRFGQCWPTNVSAQFSTFPKELSLVCGQHRLDIEFCQYLSSPAPKKVSQPTK